MEGDNISFTLYEDDAKYTGHNDFNEANKIISISSVVKKGVAEAKFPMAQYYWASTIANLRTAKEDKNEGVHHDIM